MDVGEKVNVQTDREEDDSETPIVTQCIAKDRRLRFQPAPVATHGSVCVHIKARTTCPDVSAGKFSYCQFVHTCCQWNDPNTGGDQVFGGPICPWLIVTLPKRDHGRNCHEQNREISRLR